MQDQWLNFSAGSSGCGGNELELTALLTKLLFEHQLVYFAWSPVPLHPVEMEMDLSIRLFLHQDLVTTKLLPVGNLVTRFEDFVLDLNDASLDEALDAVQRLAISHDVLHHKHLVHHLQSMLELSL